MGGSGGIFNGVGRSPAEVAQKLLAGATAEQTAKFETELSAKFVSLLGDVNQHDTELTAERLSELKDLLREQIEGSIDTLFGGSVAKHTYVDGISDIDSMLIINGSSLEDLKPDTVLARVSKHLSDGLPKEVRVEKGAVAVTVTYPDGTQIQLVPSVRVGDAAMKVPAWGGNEWSTINPDQFREGLTKRNAECNQKLIPTLKIVKAINANLPEGSRLSGYHIESIGVEAFRNYDGDKTLVKMLPHFFAHAKTAVLKPMVDRTGQSVHVDSNLGEQNSAQRVVLSHVLDRVVRRMQSAAAAGSTDRWMDLLGD